MIEKDEDDIIVRFLLAIVITSFVMERSTGFFVPILGFENGIIETGFKITVIFPIAFWATKNLVKFVGHMIPIMVLILIMVV